MTQHLVAVGNYLLGSTNFMILSLPDAWQFFTGLHPAEVDHSIQVRDTRWVTDGRASYFLHSGQPGGKVELSLLINEGEIARWLNSCRDSDSGGQLSIGGHTAFYRLRPRRQSWFNRNQGDILEVVFFCDVTRRTLRLEFSGPEQEEQRQALLGSLHTLVCH